MLSCFNYTSFVWLILQTLCLFQPHLFCWFVFKNILSISFTFVLFVCFYKHFVCLNHICFVWLVLQTFCLYQPLLFSLFCFTNALLQPQLFCWFRFTNILSVTTTVVLFVCFYKHFVRLNHICFVWSILQFFFYCFSHICLVCLVLQTLCLFQPQLFCLFRFTNIWFVSTTRYLFVSFYKHFFCFNHTLFVCFVLQTFCLFQDFLSDRQQLILRLYPRQACFKDCP